ncbi:MAG: hypothetical protein H0V29_05160 [Thermoleophilaceae bacterium]|nr:hypothetical protein [Thermoleophilaceae bacterium]
MNALERDDRVLSVTRIASAVIVVILLPALVVLWGMPDRTDELWSWTIKAQMTPIFMGSVYGAGAYFFTRVLFEDKWHRVSAGVLAAAVFAALALIPTIAHFDKFNQGDAPTLAAIAFYGWVSVYIVSPVLVGWLWWRNQRTDPGNPEPGDPLVPPPVRQAARVVAAGAFATALVLMLLPGTAADIWPWDLTPLTSRVLACMTAQLGVGAVLLSLDERWSSWRILLQTVLVASALLLGGIARRWDDLDHSRPLTWAFVAGLIGMAIAIALLYRRMSAAKA